MYWPSVRIMPLGPGPYRMIFVAPKMKPMMRPTAAIAQYMCILSGPGQHTAAHHGPHLDCELVSQLRVHRVPRVAVRLSRVEGPLTPPAAPAGTGMLTNSYRDEHCSGEYCQVESRTKTHAVRTKRTADPAPVQFAARRTSRRGREGRAGANAARRPISPRSPSYARYSSQRQHQIIILEIFDLSPMRAEGAAIHLRPGHDCCRQAQASRPATPAAARLL